MPLEIHYLDRLDGAPAEDLWRAGMTEIARQTPHGRVTPPPPDLVGWVVYQDGEAVALSARRLDLALGEAEGVLTYVRPGHRGARLYAAIQARMDADLLAMGVTQIRSTVLDTPVSGRMTGHILARGGVKIGTRRMATPDGEVLYHTYLRPLSAASAAPGEDP